MAKRSKKPFSLLMVFVGPIGTGNEGFFNAGDFCPFCSFCPFCNAFFRQFLAESKILPSKPEERIGGVRFRRPMEACNSMPSCGNS